jgi:hypothetical protein
MWLGRPVIVNPIPCRASEVRRSSPNKRMQAARANAIWYGHSMLTGVDKVPLLGRGDAREPDAGRYAPSIIVVPASEAL